MESLKGQAAIPSATENWAWWYMSILLEFGRQRKGKQDLKASISYMISSRPAWTV